MVAKVISGGITGVEGYKVEVEVDMSAGLPAFDIVGLPDSAVKESRERVHIAIKNSGIVTPVKRITINLAPADTRKEGPSFDLPIAVGLLVCMGIITDEKIEGIFFTGELSLDGDIRPVNGVLPMINGIKKFGIKKAIVPWENGTEAALVDGVEVVAVKNLKELIAHLTDSPIKNVEVDIQKILQDEYIDFLDFSDVKGQENVKRSLEIAAAGAHNIIMIGPPGSGKTMLAKRIPGILPGLTFEESIEVTKIYSVSGLLKNKGSLITRHPFRAPHHTVSYAALTGGGRVPKPGEISLAHNGVLFLDELPEFHKNVLEVLRQPLEEGFVTISRAMATITYPSEFMLVSAINPCPCGYYGDSDRCTCTMNEVSKYLKKISGPLLDRIDIQVEAPTVRYNDLEFGSTGETSAEIKKRVIKARQVQAKRYALENIKYNSQLTASSMNKYCKIDKESNDMLRQAYNTLKLSARAVHKILKVARTIADLDGEENILLIHLAEAIQYRSLDRKYWN